MKNLFILGNWKSNKTHAEAVSWENEFSDKLPPVPEHLTVIVCPAFHHLPVFSLPGRGYALGVQNISAHETGAYTGEIAASMVKDMVTYAMIGHSERRSHLGESDTIVAEKVKRALDAGIRPVVCVSALDQVRKLYELAPEFGEKGLLLYEPLFAIGSGTSDTPENANKAAAEIHGVFSAVPILYGGSVTAENVKGFMNTEHLSGVGVGGASLDPAKFLSLIGTAL